ncbi:hypothetical protein D3C87_1776040 [compost metagenome]
MISLSFDETTFEICVDHASSLRSFCICTDRPCTHFSYTRSEVSLKTQQSVSFANQTIQTWFCSTQCIKEVLTFFNRKKSNLSFHRRTDQNNFVVLFSRTFLNRFCPVIAASCEVSVVDVHRVKNRFCSQQMHFFQSNLF